MFFRSGDVVVENRKEKVMKLLAKLEAIAKVLDKVQNHIGQPDIKKQLTQGFDIAGELYDSRCLLEDVKEDLQIALESYELLKEACSHIEWLTEEQRRQSTKDFVAKIDDHIKEIEG